MTRIPDDMLKMHAPRLCKVNRIIILISQPFNAYVATKFDFKKFLDEGFLVEVFDLSAFMMPGCARTLYRFEDERLAVYRLPSRTEFLAALRDRTGSAVLIDHANPTPWIRAAANRLKIPVIRLLTGGLPVSAPVSTPRTTPSLMLLRRSFALAKRGGMMALASMIWEKLHRRLEMAWKKPHIDVVILGGEQLLSNERAYLNEKTRIVKSHVHDADRFQTESKASAGFSVDKNRGYLVFVDQNIPYHPDFTLMRMRYSDPDVYYSRLRHLFDRIEALGYEVIVSLHPRDEGLDARERFGNRLLSMGTSSALVVESCGVITHCSNAINFAVLAGKPILFVADDELMDLLFQIKILCQWFDKSPIMLDRAFTDDDIEHALRMNASAMARYRASFIQCDQGSPWLSITDLLLQEVRLLEQGAYTKGVEASNGQALV